MLENEQNSIIQEPSPTKLLLKNKPDITINQIINHIGYSIIQIQFFTLTFIIIFLNGMTMTLISHLSIPLQVIHRLTALDLKILSSAAFLGVLIGSFSMGIMIKLLGRRHYFILNLLLLNLGHVIFSLLDGMLALVVGRVMTGFAVGVIAPLSISILTEVLPTKSRNFVLNCIFVGFGLGQIALLICVLFYMPNYEIIRLRFVCLIVSSITICASIALILLYEDTPRYLILNSDEFRGLRSLDHLASRYLYFTLSDDQKISLIKDAKGKLSDNHHNLDSLLVRYDKPKSALSQYKRMFSRKYLRVTLLMTVIVLIKYMILYGPQLVFAYFVTQLGLGSVQNTILSAIGTSFSHAILGVLGGGLSETALFKRKNTLMLSCCLSFLFVLLIVIVPSKILVWFIFFYGFNGMGASCSLTFSAELYKSSIRDTALGYFFGVSKLGSFLSQFVYLLLYFSFEPYLVWYFTLVLEVVCMVCIFLIPYDTYGRAVK